MRRWNPYAPSMELPPPWFVHSNMANEDYYTPMPGNVYPPERMHSPAEPTASMQSPPLYTLPLPPPGMPPSWVAHPDVENQEFERPPPEPSDDIRVSPMRLTPPPPPPEMPSSSNSQPTTAKQAIPERSTRAKNWVRTYPEVPQAPPERPSSSSTVKLERSTSTPGSDLPSLQLAPTEPLSDPKLLKRCDSDPLHTMTERLCSDAKADVPREDGLEDVKKLLTLGEKRRMTLEAVNAKLKQSKTSDPGVSMFKKMETHYKEKMKAWADKYNTLKHSYEALLQERGQQEAKQSNSMQNAKNDVDDKAERSADYNLQMEINKLRKELRVKNEELQRRQEASFDASGEKRRKRVEDENKDLRKDIESYKYRINSLNRENDHLLESNVDLEAKQLKQTAKLEDFRKKIDELRKELADRDKTIESQKKKDAQQDRATQVQEKSPPSPNTYWVLKT